MITFKELQGKLIEYVEVYVILQRAINDEILAMMQYLSGLGNCKDELIKKEFNEHALEEYEHAKKLFEILKELGGNYKLYNPSMMFMNSDCGFRPAIGDKKCIINDNIKGEQCAIGSYNKLLVSYDFSDKHKQIIKEIIKDEEKHLKDLKELLEKIKD